MVLFAERISAKRHSLIYRTEVIFTIYGARSREPTIIRRSSINTPPATRKKRPKRAFSRVGGGGRS